MPKSRGSGPREVARVAEDHCDPEGLSAPQFAPRQKRVLARAFFGVGFDVGTRKVEAQFPGTGLGSSGAQRWIKFPLQSGTLRNFGEVVSRAGRDVGRVFDGAVAIDREMKNDDDRGTHAGEGAWRDAGHDALGNLAVGVTRSWRTGIVGCVGRA